jgi:DNA-binding response OmpR family regulator
MAVTVEPHVASTEARLRPRVLFIDDNLVQLDLYAMVLEHDVDVMKATRGESGYALAQEERFDVIVIDVMLPDVDGLAICERLRANPSTASIPVIVLTGDDDAYARAQAVRSELTGVLLKPCPADRLLSAIRAAMERSASAR